MEEHFDAPPVENHENGAPENGFPDENGDHGDEKPVSILDLQVKPPQGFRPRFPRYIFHILNNLFHSFFSKLYFLFGLKLLQVAYHYFIFSLHIVMRVFTHTIRNLLE